MSGIPISRRELLRTAAALGGMVAASALLEACGSGSSGATWESREPVPTPSATPEEVVMAETATRAPATEPSATPMPTASPQAPTRTPEAHATAAPSPTPEPSVTARPTPSPTAVPVLGRVAFVKTRDRAEGVRRALALLGANPARGNRVLLKPNFNSADPVPGSTDNTVLRTLVEELWEMGARSITVADRSGMGDTRQVMERKGVFGLAQELGFETLVFDDLDAKGWVMQGPGDSYWQRGFAIARACVEADAVVQTCCLKTHRFGGHFTLSLKNSVGMVAKFSPGDGYNYMNELHNSPHQRRMIADINAAYSPALVVVDGVEGFVNGGPDAGQRVDSEVVLAGADRVALDAVGVALLRHFGTTDAVSAGPIFQQEQIARAVELGLGVEGPEQIQLLTDDADSAAYAETIRGVFSQG